MALSNFLNKAIGEVAEDKLADQIGDVAKKGAEVVIEKIKGAEADGPEEAGQKEDKDKDKGGLISDILGGDSDKKEGGGIDVGSIASSLFK